ncbi:MAG: DUF928 domain-containing protein [Cyanobacteria bacterium P01_H01_bin.21]
MKLTNFLTNLGSTYILSKHPTHRAALVVLLGVLCCFSGIAQAADEDQVRQGLPGRRVSGASRLPSSACAVEPLVAIVPESNLGATAVPKPTLWLSMPEVSAAKQLEFYLFNAQDEIIYQTNFTVEPAADLVGLDFSNMADAPKLEIDQRYRWAASIVCNPNNRSENISVEGWIDRVDASTSGSRGLWYDRLGVLMEQLQQQPQDQSVLSQWQTLMASARLEQIVPLSIDTDSVGMPTAATTD